MDPRQPQQARDISKRRRSPADVRSAAFPLSLRGYDRRVVDAYVSRLERMIAELEVRRAPESAVERALARAERQRSRILEQAREAANAITAAARREAEEMIANAKAEAVNIVVNASAEADRRTAAADAHAASTAAEAEKILATSQTRAAAQLQRAQEEAGALREEAAAWARELRRDTEAIWGKRRELLDDLRAIAARLRQAASHSPARADTRLRSSA